MDKEQLLQVVLSCGATKATIIPQSQIVMSAHFRDICASNQCGGYGSCWMCPPEIGEIDEWGKRRLAYLINDEAEGYYVLYNFVSGPEFPMELERVGKIDDNVLRSMVVRKDK